MKVMTDPGESFLDRMISLVEGAKRQKTPNEIALTTLLAVLTLIFLDCHYDDGSYGGVSKRAIRCGHIDRLVSLFDPDHHRCAAFSYRYCRYGPCHAV